VWRRAGVSRPELFEQAETIVAGGGAGGSTFGPRTLNAGVVPRSGLPLGFYQTGTYERGGSRMHAYLPSEAAGSDNRFETALDPDDRLTYSRTHDYMRDPSAGETGGRRYRSYLEIRAHGPIPVVAELAPDR
jgi:hypothetical protein